jgi:hypothetical protein
VGHPKVFAALGQCWARARATRCSGRPQVAGAEDKVRCPRAALCALGSQGPGAPKPGRSQRGAGSVAEKWGTMRVSNFRKSL